jgi:anti-sigma factor RsiW
MSRDRRDANERDAELLTAFVDGASELPPDERDRIEALLARDPEARADEAALRTLLGSLRALPDEGAEPDWTAMARSIHEAVGQDVPRPWWRRWRWLVPVTTCAAAVAVLLVVWPRLWTRPAPTQVAVPAPITEPDVRAPELRDDVVALWLDGAPVDVDLSAADLLASAGDDAPTDPTDPTELDAGVGDDGLLPATNLAWLDSLDEEALARVERLLAAPSDPAGSTPGRPDEPGPQGSKG